jgi:hypothetical protein
MGRLKDIWINKGLIFEGVWNTIFRKKYVERIAAERMAICNECEELDEEGTECAFTNTQPCCSECGCSLAYKTRSLSSACPYLYWRALEEEDEEEEND